MEQYSGTKSNLNAAGVKCLLARSPNELIAVALCNGALESSLAGRQASD